MALRTILTLHPGRTQSGRDCLRGSLPRQITTRDADGRERVYPSGTAVMLLRDRDGDGNPGPGYRLLAVLSDDQAEPISITSAGNANTPPTAAETESNISPNTTFAEQQAEALRWWMRCGWRPCSWKTPKTCNKLLEKFSKKRQGSFLEIATLTPRRTS